jgi:hypothetical protein
MIVKAIINDWDLTQDTLREVIEGEDTFSSMGSFTVRRDTDPALYDFLDSMI